MAAAGVTPDVTSVMHIKQDKVDVADAQKMPQPYSGASVVIPGGASAFWRSETNSAAEPKGEGQGEGSKTGEKGQGDSSKPEENGQGDNSKAGEKGAGGGSMAVEEQPEAGPSGEGQGSSDMLTNDEVDFNHLGRRLSNVFQLFRMKRTKLDTSRKDMVTMNLSAHQLRRAADAERGEAQELRQQLEIVGAAARRWEEERGALVGAASRQKVQLAAAHAERDSLKDEARDLQLENMRLQRQLEELEGQLQCRTGFTDINNNKVVRLREIHDAIKGETQKLIDDQARLQNLIEYADRTCNNALDRMQHFICLLEMRKKECESLENEIANLRSQVSYNFVAAPEQKYPEFTKEDELVILQEMISDLQDCVKTTTARCDKAIKMYSDLVGSCTSVTMSEAVVQANYAAEQERAKKLEANNTELMAEIAKLKENLKSMEKALATERVRAKKAECVERGVQCDAAEIQANVADVQDNQKNEAAPDETVAL